MRFFLALFFTLNVPFFLCAQTSKVILPGIYQTKDYFADLYGKNIAIVANQTSYIGNKHLLDTLLGAQLHVIKIFSPEHGFRGNIDAGESINNSIDEKTGLPVISLYGSHYQPTISDLRGVDVVVFDIQDVGVRFYTYISTLHYVMNACAEQQIPLIVLDRPNPNGFYVDGPVLEPERKSFVGIHPIPIVYGMTMGELALMIQGEEWIPNSGNSVIKIIKCKNYNHSDFYRLPIPPSPNLKTMQSVYLYPSLALFEGTIVSEGRGTPFPFMFYGHPDFPDSLFSIMPKSILGETSHPKCEGELCYGYNLSVPEIKPISGQSLFTLSFLLNAYQILETNPNFFNPFINNLYGNNNIINQILDRQEEYEIRQSWEPKLEDFKNKRKKYLLYQDFN